MQTAEMVAGVSGAGGRVVIFPFGQNVVHAIAYISVGPVDFDLASQRPSHLAPRLVCCGRIPAANGLSPRIVDPVVDQGLETSLVVPLLAAAVLTFALL